MEPIRSKVELRGRRAYCCLTSERLVETGDKVNEDFIETKSPLPHE